MLSQAARLLGLFSLTASTSWIPIPNMVSLWGHPFFRCQENMHSKWNTSVSLLLALTPHSAWEQEKAGCGFGVPRCWSFWCCDPTFSQDNVCFSLRTKYEDYPKKAGAKEVYWNAAEKTRGLMRAREGEEKKKTSQTTNLDFRSSAVCYALAFFLRATRSIPASKGGVGGEEPPGSTD